MIRHLIALVLLLSGTSCLAQETHVIEPSNIEVRYEASYVGEYVNSNGKLRNMFILRCGATTSQYFCREKVRHDSLSSTPEGLHIYLNEVNAALERARAGGDKPTYLPDYSDKLYRNMATGEVVTYTSVMGEGFRMTDTPSFQWNLEMDSTKTIAVYECHLATTFFRGRTWKAWFADDIPLSLGPWKLAGLPGLILEAECVGVVKIEAFQILTKGLTPVTFYNYFGKKYSSIERTRFLKSCIASSRSKGTLHSPLLETE